MSKLRVLIIEDSEDDTHFLIRELKRGGFDAYAERVETLQDLGAALDNSEWDLIISDHSLPGFGSLHALELVRQRSLDIPFIIVSGTIGEDVAVKAMKAGANDYVLKKQMNRLVPAIDRELAEAQNRHIRRQAELALLRSEQELNDFFECAPVGLHWLGPEGTILRVNQAELDLLGYEQDEYQGHPLAEFCAEPGVAEDVLRRLHAGQSLKDYETRMRCKDGTFRHVQINSNALRENGEFIHSRCFTRDITDRKQGEEASAYLAAIVDTSDDAIIGTSLDGIIRSWNRGAERLYGYTGGEIQGRPISSLAPPYRPDEQPDFHQRIREGERIAHFETLRLRKDGTVIPVSITLSPISDKHGVVTGVSAIERDITEIKRQEQERLKLITELSEALASIKTLRGLLPVCSWCKKVRDDRGYWELIESYLTRHTEAEITHGICPECAAQVSMAVEDGDG